MKSYDSLLLKLAGKVPMNACQKNANVWNINCFIKSISGFTNFCQIPAECSRTWNLVESRALDGLDVPVPRTFPKSRAQLFQGPHFQGRYFDEQPRTLQRSWESKISASVQSWHLRLQFREFISLFTGQHESDKGFCFAE